MGVVIAFKDSIPLLIITADVHSLIKEKNAFQDIDLIKIINIE
jgi:thiamine pyrophosphate-dependent acetolactate synthase large subunit-like protein